MPPFRTVDESDNVIWLANVPNAGTTVISTTTQRGNPRHDSASGKFGSGGKRKPVKAPANVDPHEFQRMLSAVRDAARQFDSVGEDQIKQFLSGRAANPDAVDIQGFIAMVRQQQISDLADILDQQFRSTSGKGKPKVRVTAPKGFVTKSIASLDQSEIDQLINTISSRGHDETEVKKFFQDKASSSVHFSDEYDPELEHDLDIVSAFSAALGNMPAPQITIQMPEPVEIPPVAAKAFNFKRGENGLIESVEEV